MCSLEFDVWGLGSAFGCGKRWADIEAQKKFSGQIRGKIAHRFVVFGDRFDVALPGDGNSVFGSFELRLKIAKVLICLQLRISFDRYQQTGRSEEHTSELQS